MTPHLHVQVSLNGAVIDDRLVRVCGRAWLGECDGAEVAFSGAILSVVDAEGSLWLKGERLEPDRPVVRELGDGQVRLEAVVPERLERDWSWVPDPRMLVATVALMLLGAFLDTLALQWRERPEPPASAAERLGRVDARAQRYPEASPESAPAREWPPAVTLSTCSPDECP